MCDNNDDDGVKESDRHSESSFELLTAVASEIPHASLYESL